MITKRFNQYLPIVCLLFLIIICLFFIVSSIDNYIIKPGQAKLSTNVYIDDSKKIMKTDLEIVIKVKRKLIMELIILKERYHHIS